MIPKLYYWKNDYKEGVSDHMINLGIVYTVFLFFVRKLNLNWKVKSYLTAFALIQEVYLLNVINSFEFWRFLIMRIVILSWFIYDDCELQKMYRNNLQDF